MKKVLSAAAIVGFTTLSTVASTSCFGPPDDTGGIPLDETTACVGGLISKTNSHTYFDVYVDVSTDDAGKSSYIVLAEGATGWSTLAGPLSASLYLADIQAKNANKPVRTVFGPGLANDLQRTDGSIKLDTASTYYVLTATGCVESKQVTHQDVSETDCIPAGAVECRVSLQYECSTADAGPDASTQDPLDVSFAHYAPPGSLPDATTSPGDASDPLAADTCLGIVATGMYVSALPISGPVCQCGKTPDQVVADLNNASGLIDTALEVRGMDTATAEALVATLLAHAEVFQGINEPIE